ncbi:MAG: AsmA family protein, partial [Steroidobacteraceae bacterium]
MPKSLKIACAAAILLVIFMVIALLYVRTRVSKPMMEALASDALGMEVTVGGRVATGLFPGLHVTLEDLRIRNRGADVLETREAQVWIDYLPLLRKEVRFGKIALSHASISIERAADGTFNFEKPDAVEVPLPAFDLASVSVSDGALHYVNRQSGDVYDARHCSLDVHGLQLLRDTGQDFMRRLSAKAEVACDELQRNAVPMSGLKFSVDGGNGIFQFRPITMRLFGAQGTGTLESDYSKAVPLHRVRYSLPQFHIEEFFKTQSPRKIARGLMDFEVDLTMHGESVIEIKQTMAGHMSLRGNGLTLEGTDLDREFSQYAASQKFNLVDGGAFFFAGPLGLVVTKGYDFAGIFQGSGGSSDIPTLISDWKVEQGVANAQDVAFATRKNRMALQGGLDFVNERFVDVTTALIDAKGCPKVKQKIHGSFQKPVVEQPNFLEALTGPAMKLLKQARDIFPGGECEVFY